MYDDEVTDDRMERVQIVYVWGGKSTPTGVLLIFMILFIVNIFERLREYERCRFKQNDM